MVKVFKDSKKLDISSVSGLRNIASVQDIDRYFNVEYLNSDKTIFIDTIEGVKYLRGISYKKTVGDIKANLSELEFSIMRDNVDLSIDSKIRTNDIMRINNEDITVVVKGNTGTKDDISISDSVEALQYSGGKKETTVLALLKYDIDNDGVISDKDAQKITDAYLEGTEFEELPFGSNNLMDLRHTIYFTDRYNQILLQGEY